VSTAILQTLSDYAALTFVRCSGCHDQLPKSSKVEPYVTQGGGRKWIVIECPRCNRFTPVKLEDEA